MNRGLSFKMLKFQQFADNRRSAVTKVAEDWQSEHYDRVAATSLSKRNPSVAQVAPPAADVPGTFAKNYTTAREGHDTCCKAIGSAKTASRPAGCSKPSRRSSHCSSRPVLDALPSLAAREGRPSLPARLHVQIVGHVHQARHVRPNDRRREEERMDSRVAEGMDLFLAEHAHLLSASPRPAPKSRLSASANVGCNTLCRERSSGHQPSP